MLRALLVVLLLANALFFGWARGWFGAAWPPPGHSQREPDRITLQVRPERFVLLAPDAARTGANAPSPVGTASPTTAPTAAPAGPASNSGGAGAAAAAGESPPGAESAALCLEAGPFTADQLAAANKMLTRLGVDVAALTEVPLVAPAWLVFAGRFADAAARRTRLQAWQRQGVPVPDLLDAPRDMAPGLVFSRHLSRADADAALSLLASRHPAIASVARVVQAPAGLARLSVLRVAAASPTLAQQLRDAVFAQQERFTRCLAP